MKTPGTGGHCKSLVGLAGCSLLPDWEVITLCLCSVAVAVASLRRAFSIRARRCMKVSSLPKLLVDHGSMMFYALVFGGSLLFITTTVSPAIRNHNPLSGFRWHLEDQHLGPALQDFAAHAAQGLSHRQPDLSGRSVAGRLCLRDG